MHISWDNGLLKYSNNNLFLYFYVDLWMVYRYEQQSKNLQHEFNLDLEQ